MGNNCSKCCQKCKCRKCCPDSDDENVTYGRSNNADNNSTEPEEESYPGIQDPGDVKLSVPSRNPIEKRKDAHDSKIEETRIVHSGDIPEIKQLQKAIEQTIRLGPINLPDDELNKHNQKIYDVVVGIDFGTTFTGYAFSFKQSRDEIHLNSNWGSRWGFRSFKTATCISFDEHDQFKEFGYDALYSHDDTLKIVQKFKMQLHKMKKEITEHMQVHAHDGSNMNAIMVFAAALKFIKEHFMESVKSSEYGPPKDILWVLTVPAIWTIGEKTFMKKAAHKAGLVNTEDAENMIIALEPEAASFYCRSIKFNDISLNAGTTYMIVDAGGGTVDIAVHEIQSNGRCKEIKEPSGGPWGGDNINKAFDALLAKVFGADFMNHCKKTGRLHYSDLMKEFELAKLKVSTNCSIFLTMSYGFTEFYNEYKNSTIANALTGQEHRGIKFNKGKMEIMPVKVMEFFNPIIQSIVEHVEHLFKQREVALKVKVLILVGGFGACPLLQEAINEKFSGKCRILIPTDPQLCVLKGAVLFGQRPDFIESRICPRTYAIKSYEDIPAQNADRKRIQDDAYECLVSILNKGDILELNTSKSLTAMPLRHYMPYVEMELYSFDEGFDTNPYSEMATKVATVRVNCPKTLSDRTITIEYTFGGTNLKVKGTNSLGESEVAHINFDSTK